MPTLRAVHFIRTSSRVWYWVIPPGRSFYIPLLVGVMEEGEEENCRWEGEVGEIGRFSITGRMIFHILCCSLSLFRLLERFCISMTFLYFLGKYDIILWSFYQTIFVLFRLYSDNANCVVCFSLTSCWCSFIRRLTIFPVSPMLIEHYLTTTTTLTIPIITNYEQTSGAAMSSPISLVINIFRKHFEKEDLRTNTQKTRSLIP